jgi:hypothetical protein
MSVSVRALDAPSLSSVARLKLVEVGGCPAVAAASSPRDLPRELERGRQLPSVSFQLYAVDGCPTVVFMDVQPLSSNRCLFLPSSMDVQPLQGLG